MAFGSTSWFVQAAPAAVAAMPYSALVGVLLYLDLRLARSA
jgi:hypothetical protein